jgi:hypothetical protein
MAPIVVDPEVLAGAGKSIGSVGEEIAAAVNALASGLAGGAPTGLDDAGLSFGIAYQKSAQALLDAAEAAVKAGRGIGFGVQMSASNYSRADAASTIGGGTPPLTAPTAPGDFSAPACPPSLGGGVPPPFLWGMVQAFIPDVWPDGDPARLTASATAWDTFATTVSAIAGEFVGPSGVIGAQQIPEGGAMTSAISELSQSLSQVASEAGKLATQTREFADDVAHTQNAIRDLLDRVSPSGFLDGVKALLSGDALEELKEIAEDIKTVLGEFGRQAEGRTQLLQQLVDWIDGSVVSMQKWARKEFTHYLGEDVGGLAANAFEFQTNVGEGFIKAGLETIQSIEQLDPTRFAYDFDGATATWGALADTAKYADPMSALTHPIGAFEHGRDMLSGLVHSEDWRADRPGLGLGGLTFEAASTVTGVGAAKTATKGAAEAAESAAARAAPEVRAMSGTAAEVSDIGANASKITEKLDNLADDVPTGALPGSNGPTIPPSLTEPKVLVEPHIPDAPAPRGVPEPTTPHIQDSPTPRLPDSPTPHAADAPSVDRSPASTHSPTPTSAPTHTPAGPGDGVPPTGHPSGGGTPMPATAGHAPEPAPVAAHAPSPVGHAPEAAPPAPHGPSTTTLESAPAHADSPDSGTGAGHASDSPSPHEADHHAGHDGDTSDGHASVDDRHHGGENDHPLTGADAFPDAHDYGDLTEAQFDREFRNDDGSLRYPDEDDPAKPYALPGTVHDLSPAEIKSRLDGQIWDRLGHPGGKWLAPEGTPYPERALPPGSLDREYHGYRVHAENPLPSGWSIEESRVAPWFGQPGGGPQFKLVAPTGITPRVQDLIDTGFLEELW